MVVVFSGYNQRAVIAFLRTLEKRKIKYVVVAADENDTIFFTKYCKRVIYTRKAKELDLQEILNVLGQIDEKKWIAPSTEFLNRFLLEHIEKLEQINCIVPLVKKTDYEMISDKQSFSMLCKKNGIKCPCENNNVKKYKEPLVAKPKRYVSKDGKIYSPVFLKSEEEYEMFLKTHQKEDFVFQEFIEGGESLYLLFYFSRKGEVYSYSQKNILQQNGGKSILAATSARYHLEKNLIEQYINMFQNMNYFGLVMVEIRRKNDIDYMIEANPRFWGPSQLFCDADKNFFEALLSDYGFIDEFQWNNEEASDVKYYWSGGKYNDCVWLIASKYEYEKHIEQFENADIYKRSDTMKLYQIEKLKKLYMETSKHSNYQILSNSVAKLLNQDLIKVKSRQEKERMDYITSKISFEGKNILDIGGNTGYFTFESIENGAEIVDYYEGNKTHAEFVELASELLELDQRIHVHPEYYMFDNNTVKYDIILNLNVIHHLGDDFGEDCGINSAKLKMIDCINSLSKVTRYMVFQMGYNWKGNRNCCLFENGTKSEMIDFITENCNEKWEIEHIGIAEYNKNGEVNYQEKDNNNIERDDSIGEFLNRPLFIMKSKDFIDKRK